MKFKEAVEIILDIEKGYHIDPKDTGGETNWGISKASYPHLDIKKLTKEEATAIYKADFWDKMHCDLLPEGLNLMIFDCAVNQGVGRARRAIQTAVGASPTGKLTMDDLEKIVHFPMEKVMRDVIAYRDQKYQEAKTWNAHGKGWMRRLNRVSIESIYASVKSMKTPLA